MTTISGRRKAGHVLGIALGVANLGALAVPTGSGESGPPFAVLAVGAFLGAAVVALLVRSWRHDERGPRRIAAVLLVLAAVGALPGLLVADVPVALQAAAGALVVLTIATVVLLFSPEPASGHLADAR